MTPYLSFSTSTGYDRVRRDGTSLNPSTGVSSACSESDLEERGIGTLRKHDWHTVYFSMFMSSFHTTLVSSADGVQAE
jgi:hypothetical protein